MSKKNIVFMRNFVESDLGLKFNTMRRGENSEPEINSEYETSVLNLLSHSTQIYKTEIPVNLFGEKLPQNLDEYDANLGKAKKTALAIMNLINKDLRILPQSEIDTLTMIGFDIKKALIDVEVLEDEGTDEKMAELTRNHLKTVCDRLQERTENIYSEIQNVLTRLDKCSSTIDLQAAYLLKIAELMGEDEAADRKAIDKLNKEIDNMKNEIASCTGAIVALSISIAASVAISALSVAVAGPVGLFLWPFTGAAIAASSYYIALNSNKISDLKNRIATCSKDIGNYNTAICLLQEQAKYFNELAAATAKTKEYLEIVVTEWKKINDGIVEMKTELEHAADWDTQTWHEVHEELQRALDKDAELCEQLKTIDIFKDEAKIAQQPIEVGLSEEEMKAAAEEVGMIPLSKFIA